MPEIVSLINIEDNSFFNRESIINIKWLLRAIYMTFKGSKQWWSWITQQIIKNNFLQDEDGYSRKIQEVFYTYNLEKTYSKLELINYYLNTVSYWKNITGIQKAGEIYLWKKELALEDWFFLNSMLKKPTYFILHTDELKDRAIYYYKQYCEYATCSNVNKWITYIKSLKINYEIKNERIWNPFIIDMVLKNKEQISKWSMDKWVVYINYSEPENQKFIDWEMLKWSETSCKKYDTCDFGAVVMNKDGKIEYLYSWDYLKNQVNVLTSDLQPGSTMKPFIYTKYLQEKDIKTTNVSFSNENICINWWCPDNWNNKSSGRVSFQTAIDLSLNLPVLHIYKEMWSEKVFWLLSDLWLFDKDEEVGDSFIIWWFPVKPIELANAYRIFLNNWQYQRFNLFKNDTYTEVLPKEKVELMNKILFNNYEYRWKFGLKTGTTNNWKDEYMIAFDKERVFLIWGGNKNWTPSKPGIFSIAKIKPAMDLLINNIITPIDNSKLALTEKKKN
jgi:penicillin-binding protein 1A